MTPSEIALAHIYLSSVEQQLVIESELRRLRENSSDRTQTRTEEQAISRRLANVEAENRRLRGQLAEAEEKLEAITSIERSIREQGQSARSESQNRDKCLFINDYLAPDRSSNYP
jgi:hypothetical protein